MRQVGHVDGYVQYCSNSSAIALELLQSCTKLLIHTPGTEEQALRLTDGIYMTIQISVYYMMSLGHSEIKHMISQYLKIILWQNSHYMPHTLLMRKSYGTSVVSSKPDKLLLSFSYCLKDLPYSQ